MSERYSNARTCKVSKRKGEMIAAQHCLAVTYTIGTVGSAGGRHGHRRTSDLILRTQYAGRLRGHHATTIQSRVILVRSPQLVLPI